MTDKKQTLSHIALISLHGLIRAENPELGRDADTGGQIRYVLEVARELARQEGVERVDLITRQIFDDRVGPDYSRVEEEIEGNARIIRLPFGPKRYLRKEALWPYIEVFIDQAIGYFKRNGLPDVIHGHYADAGLAGAYLARLLHVPFVFTGHSLGRVKRQRLLAGNGNAEAIERQYNLSTRVEAEEFALETASIVITSTYQEVEEQYALYDHYVPERMEVIPPGVDLDRYTSDPVDEESTNIVQETYRFLKDPDKPLIMTMARPDERKNLDMLVKVYGESKELQKHANLLLILGTRDDLRDLPSGQQKVIRNILTLIDVYDLYGKVAYPKTHLPSEVPDLYRLLHQKKGIFINPALTEPFGLTLLEAAASGVPVVATNDGGPLDIIANCRNGLLVDPLNPQEIEHALMRMLTEPEQWEEWSRNGLQGAREHYTWNTHARRYVRDLNDILTHSAEPALATPRKKRQIPNFDRLIITDLDNTLTGDNEALAEFIDLIKQYENVGFGIATGRPLSAVKRMVEDLNLPMPDLLNTAVGTELYYGEGLVPDHSWRDQIGYQWKPDEIRAVLDEQPGFYRQRDEQQTEFKISYEIDTQVAPSLTEIKTVLRQAGLRANVVLSLGMYLDVIPVRGGSEYSMRHLLYRWGFAPEKVLVAGDCGNDEGMLKGRTLGVVVGNHSPELNKLKNWPRIYFAEATHARGIIEGIQYYQFLDNITIPNDQVDE
ncbi:HAD-IIB family hydrolase [bacterium]|uniref:sucrose-phosphate synthase n=1 Tax=Rubinisphaera brasiliensis (strain ATCC 49424 / DSM 5305 / JCM 21570 / IAM 15109 / NBRC 103401 / IFAM 1448) TaxID=756272 RepID=F0SKM1_RUBBR|nr:HAD-IIB family hydrolase [Rubinisphaera brasiliensis]ADY57639.1 sucrose-phosphate synthase [Rubinisphaera brasiliensis DSM 5305]MBR9801642.1 HAD-IIB family hydrolase [bacterium]